MFGRKRQQQRDEIIVNNIVDEVNQLLSELHISLDGKINEIVMRLDVIESQVDLMNKKMASKEMRDKQDYGHLVYKVHELSEKRKANGSDS